MVNVLPGELVTVVVAGTRSKFWIFGIRAPDPRGSAGRASTAIGASSRNTIDKRARRSFITFSPAERRAKATPGVRQTECAHYTMAARVAGAGFGPIARRATMPMRLWRAHAPRVT